MTLLESKITAFLVDFERVFEPNIITAKKWIIISDTKKQTKIVIDKQASIEVSYSKSAHKFQKMDSYIAAKEAFCRDTVFADAVKTAGLWGGFDGAMLYILSNTCKITSRKIIFNHPEAIEKLKKLRKILSEKNIRYLASARLIGVTSTLKRIKFPGKVEIVRLAKKERNDKQPLIHSYLSYGMYDISVADSNLELTAAITVPVDHSRDSALFVAQNEALKKAKIIFGNVVNSILLATSGKVMLGYIEIHGGIEQMPVGRGMIQESPPSSNITISKKDVVNISTAYQLITNGKNDDKTLGRALHRYLLGRTRRDLNDKLVDYVVAWEAILLTQKGGSITQELSYRFSLNGASMLNAVNKKLNKIDVHKKMKSAYDVRSKIVHGGTNMDIANALKKGGFDNLQELCDFLENNFRNALFWLINNDTKNRPYRKINGWEELIWQG